MTYEEADELIREHIDYGGSLDVHALAVAIASTSALSAPAPIVVTEGEQDEREAFEAWANENGVDVRLGPYKDSGYLYLEGAVAWRAWQARAALSQPSDAAAEPGGNDALWEVHLMEAVELTIDTLARQLDLIAERAPGKFLDKVPVVRSLTAHKQRLERAAAERNASFTASPAASGKKLTGDVRNQLERIAKMYSGRFAAYLSAEDARALLAICASDSATASDKESSNG
jgi:hypothetical protein